MDSEKVICPNCHKSYPKILCVYTCESNVPVCFHCATTGLSNVLFVIKENWDTICKLYEVFEDLEK